MKEKSIPAELNKDKMHEHLITENVEYQIGRIKYSNCVPSWGVITLAT